MNVLEKGLQGFQVAPEMTEGGGALAYAQSALGASVGRIGSNIYGIGKDIQEDYARQDALNRRRATAAYIERFQQYSDDLPRMSHTDSYGLSKHNEIPDLWETGWSVDGEDRVGAKQLRENLAKGIKIESNRKEWLNEIETNIEPKLREMAKQKAEDMREEYADVVIPRVIETLVLSGLVDAEQLFGEIEQMFLPEEWNRNPQDGKKPSISARVATNIATKLAETDPQMAADFAQKWIPPKFRDEATRTINANITAANAQQERARKEERDASNRKIYGDTILFNATQGKEGQMYKPSEYKAFLEAGLIDKVTFDAGMASATDPERKTDPWKEMELSDFQVKLQQGKISLSEYEQKEREAAPFLSDAKLASMHKSATSDYGALFGNISSDARRQFDVMFPVTQDYDEQVSTLARAICREQFDQEIKEARDKNEKIDSSYWENRAISIALRHKTELDRLNKPKGDKRAERMEYLKSQSNSQWGEKSFFDTMKETIQIAATRPQPKVNDVLTVNGKQYKVVGFDTDREPLVEEGL